MDELVRTAVGSVSEVATDSWIVSTDEGTTVFDDLGAALLRLGDLASDALYGTTVTYNTPIERLLAAVVDAGGDSLFAGSENGWVRVDGYWLPAGTLPEGNGDFSEFEAIANYGEFGVDVVLYRWNDLYLWHESGPEYENAALRVLGRVTEKHARASASSRAFDLMDEWNLLLPTQLGLDNLSESDRFDLPAAADPFRRYTSYTAVGDPVADVIVYTFVDPDGAPSWLVTKSDDQLVIGRYSTLEDLERAVNVGDGPDAEFEQLGSEDGA